MSKELTVAALLGIAGGAFLWRGISGGVNVLTPCHPERDTVVVEDADQKQVEIKTRFYMAAANIQYGTSFWTRDWFREDALVLPGTHSQSENEKQAEAETDWAIWTGYLESRSPGTCKSIRQLLRRQSGSSASLGHVLSVLDLKQPLFPHEKQNAKIAVTGTVDGLGNVGPVGAVRPKTIGCIDAGMDALILPEQNLDEAIPVAARVGFALIPVRTVDHAVESLARFFSNPSAFHARFPCCDH